MQIMKRVIVFDLLLFMTGHVSSIPFGKQRLTNNIPVKNDLMGAWKEDDILGDGIQGIPKGCGGKPVDVFFAIDTSNDVSEEDVGNQIQYIKSLANIFLFEGDLSRVGLVVYGATARPPILLGSIKSRDRFIEVLPDFISRVGGTRNLGEVIRYIRRRGFESDLSRPEVAHVIILLTRGNSLDKEYSAEQAYMLKRTGAYIFVVKVGSDVDKREITAIASAPAHEFVFDSEQFDISNSLTQLLNIQSCNVSVIDVDDDTKACTTKRPVDLLFVVDHLGLGATNTKNVLNFIDAVSSDMQINENINIGLLTNKSPYFSTFSKGFEPVDEFKLDLAHVEVPGFRDIMRRTRRTFSAGRPRIQKTMVLFVDENIEIDKYVLREARRNKFKKIETYVVSIGDNIDVDSLNMVASGKYGDNLIRVPTYTRLVMDKDRILATICRGL